MKLINDNTKQIFITTSIIFNAEWKDIIFKNNLMEKLIVNPNRYESNIFTPYNHIHTNKPTNDVNIPPVIGDSF